MKYLYNFFQQIEMQPILHKMLQPVTASINCNYERNSFLTDTLKLKSHNNALCAYGEELVACVPPLGTDNVQTSLSHGIYVIEDKTLWNIFPNVNEFSLQHSKVRGLWPLSELSVKMIPQVFYWV